jgi:hypothetical protein
MCFALPAPTMLCLVTHGFSSMRSLHQSCTANRQDPSFFLSFLPCCCVVFASCCVVQLRFGTACSMRDLGAISFTTQHHQLALGDCCCTVVGCVSIGTAIGFLQTSHMLLNLQHLLLVVMQAIYTQTGANKTKLETGLREALQSNGNISLPAAVYPQTESSVAA